ncbi:hypothetical protein CSC2_12640 [Clostridium zeae]|uniref:Phage head morphogenesis domain-containing protein n=1 Tax=Clostridium zeae TaxID=2759022 RepID=A0ABQ1E8A9_9CLOT|nr:phage minor head protein [Clostridium zeae]GFZ30738.1 hypothetical protein CSC2_12640 [Clostridium zeae]
MSKYHEELLKLAEKDEDSTKALLMKAHVSAIADMKSSIGDYLQTNENIPFAKQLELKKIDKLLDQMNDILGKLYDKNYNSIATYGKSTLNREYFGVFYEVEGVLNSELNFGGLKEDEIKEVLEAPVAGLKLSERLYDKHLNEIKLKVKGAVTEGLINNKGYGELAKNLSDIGNSNYNNTVKIAVTEAGRIKSLAKQKGLEEAVKSGVSLKKKWIAVSDKKTRVDHQQLNGQVVDIDEKFHLHGYSTSQPRLFGVAKEDIGCRCDCETVVEEDSVIAENNKVSEVKKYDNFEQWYKDRVNNNERLDDGKSSSTSIKDKTASANKQDNEGLLEKDGIRYNDIGNVASVFEHKYGKLIQVERLKYYEKLKEGVIDDTAWSKLSKYADENDVNLNSISWDEKMSMIEKFKSEIIADLNSMRYVKDNSNELLKLSDVRLDDCINNGYNPEDYYRILNEDKNNRTPDDYLTSLKNTKLTENWREAFYGNGSSVVISYMPKDAYNNFVLGYGTIGRPGEKGGQFVLPQKIGDSIESKLANLGSISNSNEEFKVQLAKELGLPEDVFANGVVRVEIPLDGDINLHIVTGVEDGCNYQWIPGGKTLGGTTEGIIRQITRDKDMELFRKITDNVKK